MRLFEDGWLWMTKLAQWCIEAILQLSGYGQLLIYMPRLLLNYGLWYQVWSEAWCGVTKDLLIKDQLIKDPLIKD